MGVMTIIHCAIALLVLFLNPNYGIDGVNCFVFQVCAGIAILELLFTSSFPPVPHYLAVRRFRIARRERGLGLLCTPPPHTHTLFFPPASVS